MALKNLRDSLKKETTPSEESKKLADEIANEIRKDTIAASIVLRKELNDLEKGINKLNVNLDRIYKAITNSPLGKPSKPGTQRQGLSNEEVSLITNPQNRRLLRQSIGNQPLNFRDVFKGFLDKENKQGSYFFQSGQQARAREDLRIKLAKKQISKEEFDAESNKIGTTAGLNPINFVKDFKEGLTDLFNFFTNKNKVVKEGIERDENDLEAKESKKELRNTAEEKSKRNNKLIASLILVEVVGIRKLLEKSNISSKNRQRPSQNNNVEFELLPPSRPQPSRPNAGLLTRDTKKAIIGPKKEDVKVTKLTPDYSQKYKPGLAGGQQQANIKSFMQTTAPAALPMLSGPSKDVNTPELPPPTPTKKEDVIDVEPKESSDNSILAAGALGATGAASKASKLSKFGGFLKNAGKTALRIGGKIALPLAALGAAYEGTTGYMNAEENLGIEGRQATLGEKLSSAGGSIVSGLSFGLVDAKAASKKIKDLTGAGPDVAPATVTQSSLPEMSKENQDLKNQSGNGGNVTVNNVTQTSQSQGSVQAPAATPRAETKSTLERYQDMRAVFT